ncbi:hypothetical protein [Janibacter sp. HTCC2649]|uniref:hypothetical protein n=1 Tax=Janibacter sp. HTCC2649 TaxID=313589 RepID=UPI00178C6660|nr:hypothetical protein [Janibacter sp. HTCC2649]
MVLVRLDGIGIAVDEVGGAILGASGRDGLEADGLDSVGRPIDDKTVARLETPTGGHCFCEQQPVQVKNQADVQGAPVPGEQVVECSAVAGELLFASGAQLDRLVGDDGGRTVSPRPDGVR